MFGLKVRPPTCVPKRSNRLEPRAQRFDLIAGGLRQSHAQPAAGQHNVYNVLAAVGGGDGARHHAVRDPPAPWPADAPADKRGRGRSTRQHHGHQRLLQFQSEGPGRDGGHAGRDAGKAPHRGCGRDAGARARRAKNCIASAAGTWRKGDRRAAGSARLGDSRWSRPRAKRACGRSSWPRPKKPASGWPAKRATVT